jgi:outer membrane protein assembly factor BamD
MLKKLIFLLITLLCISCSKDIKKESLITEKDLNLQVREAYEEGLNSLKQGDVLFAAKKFNEAEILFPQSDWAPRASLMAAYAYYSQDYYGNAIAELERFIKIYPKNKNIDYAYYLLAVAYYEQIIDEKKDLQTIIKAKINFPNTNYSLDAQFKLDLINDILASKEMYIGRYYFDKKKWIPAINRFKTVVDDFNTTIYIEEALYRLVEIYYLLGLINESEKYAKTLGYNYQSSKWYENSYILFNEKYKKSKSEKLKKNNNIIKKIKSIFN